MTQDNKRIVLSKNNGWWKLRSNWHFFIDNQSLCNTYAYGVSAMYFKTVTKKNKRCSKCQKKIIRLMEMIK